MPSQRKEPVSRRGDHARRSTARHGSGIRVDEVMKEAQACRVEDSVAKCARLMEKENIGFVPLCDDDGKPAGTLTDRDLALRVVARERPATTKAGEVMTREIVACRLGRDLSDAEQLMRARRKSRIMVCDDEGTLVGVISLSDIAEVEDEREAGLTLRGVAQRESRHPSAH